MDNIRLVQLCTQALAMRYCTREELRAQVGSENSEKVPNLRGKQRDDFIAYLTSKFGRLYSVFDTRGVLHIVGGLAISTAAMYVLSEFKHMPYLWSPELPRSMGGNLGTSAIKRQAREAKNFLVVIGGAVHIVPHDPQAPSVPSGTDEVDEDDVQPTKKRAVAKTPALAASYGEAHDTSFALQECGASGADHSYGPHGPNGKLQCEYCGNEMPHAVPSCKPSEIGEGWLTVSAIKELEGKLGVTYGSDAVDDGLQRKVANYMVNKYRMSCEGAQRAAAEFIKEMVVDGNGETHVVSTARTELIDGQRWLYVRGHEPEHGPAAPRAHALQRLWGEK